MHSHVLVVNLQNVAAVATHKAAQGRRQVRQGTQGIGWAVTAKAGTHSMLAEGARWLSGACAKARSVSSSAQYSPRSTAQERRAPPRRRHSRTLPLPQDAIL